MTIERKKNRFYLKQKQDNAFRRKAKNFINSFSLIMYRIFRFRQNFVFGKMKKERKVFRFGKILTKSQHKEGLYHCERRTLCVWIFFLILLVMCTRNDDEKKNRMLYKVVRKTFHCFLFANIFYLLRIEFFFLCSS